MKEIYYNKLRNASGSSGWDEKIILFYVDIRNKGVVVQPLYTPVTGESL